MPGILNTHPRSASPDLKEEMSLVVGKSLVDPRETVWYFRWREGNGLEGRIHLGWDTMGTLFAREDLGVGLCALADEQSAIALGALGREQRRALKALVHASRAPALPRNVPWMRSWKRNEWYLAILRAGEAQGLFSDAAVHRCYMQALAENWLAKEAICAPPADVFEPDRHAQAGLAGNVFAVEGA
ncbi:hypothetical protein PsYK624_039050 [Phanerochaete sordida]|uniref:Uncharacterized protein n=1 Tax=Phanerochaete sordida TaxID=48140 RepID=A0A9P3LBH0_9APHY|nr:hypothetical protein PsYK624_039050 [Phanerochaete sordida]